MRVRTQIVIIALLRIILNTMHRMVYPFLTVFARGLGVDVTAVSLALAGRNIAGIFGPIVAPVADSRGRKFGMLLGIVAFTLGVGLVAVRPSLPTFVAALVLGILGKSWFDPAVHAYFGDRVAYEQRGTAVAVTEMSWSIAFIVGVPAMGFLIAHYGWSAPFPILTVLGVFMLVVIWWVIPRDRATAERQSLFPNVQELSGESLVATVTDRLGKPRAVALGLGCNIAASLLLPLIGRTEFGALAGLFLFYLSFEYLVVSQLPMMTEVVPGARATAIALNSVGFGIGRSLGALLSTFIYVRLGFPAVTGVAVLFDIFALLALAEMQRKIGVLPRLIGWLRRTPDSSR
jgi:predicted MFS family arabinose efflux permease